MAYPGNIANGDTPDAEVLQSWLTKLSLKRLTYDAMITFALANPTDLFICLAYDIGQVYFYSGDTSDGADGFIVIG